MRAYSFSQTLQCVTCVAGQSQQTEGSHSGEKPTTSSNIPRFTGLANRKTEEKKPITPGLCTGVVVASSKHVSLPWNIVIKYKYIGNVVYCHLSMFTLIYSSSTKIFITLETFKFAQND